mgnify:CR=1 FL=1
MTDNVNKILKRSLEYMKQNGSDKIVLRSRNQDELVAFINTFPRLIDEGFIIPISDNYDLNTYDIIKDTLFEFKLTYKAMSYCESQNLK